MTLRSTQYNIINQCVQAQHAPTSHDDGTQGLLVGLGWQDNSVSPPNRYVCLSIETGSAIWKSITTGGSGGAVDSVNTRTGDITLVATDIPTMRAAGVGHAGGVVPDPGASAGTARFLREDATWAIPPGSSGAVASVNTRTGAIVLGATDIPAFVASGTSHAPGAVPDPGVTAGSTKFLREDATWAVPAGGGGGAVASVNTRTGAIVLGATDIPVFVASGSSSAPGAVPDPGSLAGIVRFLREDAQFINPLEAFLHDYYGGKGTEALPGTSDSGQTILPFSIGGAGSALTVVSGLLTNTSSAAGSVASYYQILHPSNVNRIGATFVFGAGANTSSLCLAIWSGGYVNGGPIPNSGFHLALTPAGYIFGYWLSGLYTQLTSGSYSTPLTQDGVTQYTVEANIYGSTALVQMPDGTLVTLSYPEIAAYAGAYSNHELYQNNASTEAKPSIVRLWANPSAGTPDLQAVTPGSVIEAILGAFNAPTLGRTVVEATGSFQPLLTLLQTNPGYFGSGLALSTANTTTGVRNWSVATNFVEAGDLVIGQSTTLGGNPFAAPNVWLYISGAGRVTLGGFVDDGAHQLQVTGSVVATEFDGPLVGDVTGNVSGSASAIPNFVASGVGHAPGAVPDPGDTANTQAYLREDATWVNPFAALTAGALMAGDGFGDLYSDPNITINAVAEGLTLGNTYVVQWYDTSGFPVSLTLDSSNNFTYFSTDSGGSPLAIFTVPAENDTPIVAFHQSIALAGSASDLIFDDQDSRDSSWRMRASGGHFHLIADATGEDCIQIRVNNEIILQGTLLPDSNDNWDIGSSGANWGDGWFAGTVTAATGLATGGGMLASGPVTGLNYTSFQSDFTGTAPALTMDLTVGSVGTISTTADSTFQVVNLVDGMTATCDFFQPASGVPFHITSWNGIVFPGGISPDLTQALNAIDTLFMRQVDGVVYGDLIPQTSPLLTNSIIFSDANGMLTTNQVAYTFTEAMTFHAGISSQYNGVTDSEFFGAGAGNAGFTGGECVGVGVNALNAITNGFSNVALGHLACASVTSGFANLGIGTQALKLVNTTNGNIGIGAYAGQVTLGAQNTFIGYTAGQNGTGTNNCVFIGAGAGIDILTASNSVFIGTGTGGTVDHAGGNTVIGGSTAQNSLGVSNVVIGQGASPSAAVVNTVSIGDSAGALGSGGIGIGRGAAPAAGQFIVGTVVNGNQVTDFYPNSASTAHSNVQPFTIHGMNASGTDAAGGQLTLSAGTSTGLGAAGSIVLQTGFAGGSTGSGVNAAQNRLVIDQNGLSTFSGPVIINNNVFEIIGTFAETLIAETSVTNGFRWTLANDGSYRLQTSANAFSTGVTATPIWMTTAGRVVFGATSDNGVDQVQVSGSVVASTYVATAGMRPGLVAKIASYLLTATDHTVLMDTTAGAATATLPSAPALNQLVKVKLINSTNTLTVAGNGKTIDGSTSLTTTVQNYAWTLQYDGTQWWIL